METFKISKEKIALLPQTSGVYIFLNFSKNPIYVGKSVNLRARVSSYFNIQVLSKTKQMVSEARNLAFIKVESEFEALILEALLVKKYLPKYNSQLRDDKSPLYVAFTKEAYPRILLLRQTQLDSQTFSFIAGPFINTRALKKIMRYLRRIFPYSQHPPGKRGCLHSQIGLCNPCPSKIVNEEDPHIQEGLKSIYFTNLREIKKILNGKSNLVTLSLIKKMNTLSKQERFEEADEYSRKIKFLESLKFRPMSPNSYMQNPNLLEDVRKEETRDLKEILSQYFDISKLKRIECYDISHMASSYPTASMVTFVGGEPDRHLYRRFRVSLGKKNNDTESMGQVLARRSKHFEDWGEPDLIIVDGGKGQVGVATEVVDAIPIVGIAKRRENLVLKVNNEFIEIRMSSRPALMLIRRIRDEAHRFARSYHHKLVEKTITSYHN